MAALLVFHLIPASSFTIPMTSSRPRLNSLRGFDPTTLTSAPLNGSKLFVKSVTVNGKPGSLCWIDFQDVVGGGTVVIEVDGNSTAAANRGCGAVVAHPLPGSLETGGFKA